MSNFIFTDPGGTGEVLRRDNQHWVHCVPDSRAAMVPVAVLVLLAYFQLLLLWREPRRLFRGRHQSYGK